jgi:hypothetical protein
MFKLIERNLSPDGDGGTGPAGGGNPGGSTPPPAAPAAPADSEKETLELTELAGKEASLDDAGKARLNELRGKYDVVLKHEDGTPLTAEEVKVYRETEAKVTTILAKPEAQRTADEIKFLKENTEDENQASVYDQVDELTGVKYDIDYGDIDPLTPQGIALREDHIADKAVEAFDNQLKAKYPRAYQLMLHLDAGGKEEDFFKPENSNFKAIVLKKDDVAGQEAALRLALTAKKMSPGMIDVLVTSLKDKGELYENAKTELEAMQKVQEVVEQQRAAVEQQRRQREEADMRGFADLLDNTIQKGFDGIVIPATDRAKFTKFIGDRIDYQNGTFYTVKTIDPKELAKELKVAYFEFKGGDLKGLVERTATTQNTLKIKAKVKQEFVPKSPAAGGGKPRIKIGDL